MNDEEKFVQNYLLFIMNGNNYHKRDMNDFVMKNLPEKRG